MILENFLLFVLVLIGGVGALIMLDQLIRTCWDSLHDAFPFLPKDCPLH